MIELLDLAAIIMTILTAIICSLFVWLFNQDLK